MQSSQGPKHVVTGHAKDGRAIIVSQESPQDIPLCGSAVSARFLWADDAVARFPNDGAAPRATAIAPPPGGSRFATLTIAAGADHDYHAFITAAMAPYAEPDAPGFHTTPTTDFVYVLSGQILLEIGESDHALLSAGDTAVLNGVRHRWRNPGAEPTTILAVQIGAHDERRK